MDPRVLDLHLHPLSCLAFTVFNPLSVELKGRGAQKDTHNVPCRRQHYSLEVQALLPALTRQSILNFKVSELTFYQDTSLLQYHQPDRVRDSSKCS